MLIRLWRIYNLRVIHASFALLSHVFTIIYIIFKHFVGLTYWQDAQCQFPVFTVFYSENLLMEISSELDENLLELLLRQDEDKDQM